jgi:hypothetical protein
MVCRVSPGPANTWRVSVDTVGAIASFDHKSAAIRYALSVARGESSWQTLAASAASASRRRPPTGFA